MRRMLRLAGPIVAALVLLAAAIGSAVFATASGERVLASLNRSSVALAAVPPVVGTGGRRLSRRVVLVVIDGLGAWRAAGLPALDELRGRGASGVATSHLPTISRPNYVSILTGVPPRDSGARTNDYAQRVPFDSIMRSLRAHGMTTTSVSDEASSLATLFGDDLTEPVYTPWRDGLAGAAARALTRATPLVILLPSAVDHCGHHHRMTSTACRLAAEQADQLVAEVVARLDLSRDTLVVTADHGHLPSGGHGGGEPEVVEVPLILVGAGIRPGPIVGAELVDVAPTIAALLGVAAPGHGLGRTLISALAVTPGEAAALGAADRVRLARNQAVVADEQARAVAAAAPARRRRMGDAALVLGLALAAIVLARRWGVAIVGRRAVLAALPGLIVPLAWLVGASEGHMSLSCFADLDGWSHGVLFAGVLAGGLTIVANLIVLREHGALLDRLAAANGIALAGLLGAWSMVLAVWAWWGAGPFVVLPGDAGLFLIVAVRLLLLPQALGIAAAITVELIALGARSARPLPFAADSGRRQPA